MQPLKPHLNAEELARQMEALQNQFKEDCEDRVYSSYHANLDVRKREVLTSINQSMHDWYLGMCGTYHNIYNMNWRIIDTKFPVVELTVQAQINFDPELYTMIASAEVK